MTLTELLTRLLADKTVKNIDMSKRPRRTCITATFEIMKKDEEPEPEPEKHMRLTRWFGKVLDKANRELLAQDGAKAVSWKTKSPRDLFQKMAQHIQELDVAIAQNKNWFGSMHATDIVNYALMIATRCTAISDGSEEWV